MRGLLNRIAAIEADVMVAEAGASPLEALELLHRGTVYDYDPRVVRSLRTVLEYLPERSGVTA